jgi:hypothetical protein
MRSGKFLEAATNVGAWFRSAAAEDVARLLQRSLGSVRTAAITLRSSQVQQCIRRVRLRQESAEIKREDLLASGCRAALATIRLGRSRYASTLWRVQRAGVQSIPIVSSNVR